MIHQGLSLHMTHGILSSALIMFLGSGLMAEDTPVAGSLPTKKSEVRVPPSDGIHDGRGCNPNPVLNFQHRVPDAEARVFGDRVYFYGSYDKTREFNYCSREYHVFSTDDFKSYTDHGVSLDSDWTPSPGKILFAPDCVKIGSQYHLFYATSEIRAWVASSDSPAGPFGNAREMKLPVNQIDPAVLVDDDGSVYYYWGQFHCHGAKLNDDLVTIDEKSYKPSLLNEMDHGFHEGASIRKINGVYYLVYADIARGRPTCLSYATSPHPLGPFTKRGVIVDNAGCDRESWNNHGSLLGYRGDWYICYHRSSMGREGMRQLCIEKVRIHPDGSIPEVKMTTQGPGEPLDPKGILHAGRACELSGMVRLNMDSSGLSRFENGSKAVYRYFSFSGENRFVARCASLFAGCRLRLRLDGIDGEILGEAVVPCTGGWETGGIKGYVDVEIPHRPLNGMHGIVLEAACDEHRSFSVKELLFR